MSLFERQGFWPRSSRVVLHMRAPNEQQSVIRVACAILERERLGRKVTLAID
jgi:hypothetical protein